MPIENMFNKFTNISPQANIFLLCLEIISYYLSLMNNISTVTHSKGKESITFLIIRELQHLRGRFEQCQNNSETK